MILHKSFYKVMFIYILSMRVLNRFIHNYLYSLVTQKKSYYTIQVFIRLIYHNIFIPQPL